MTGHVHVHPWTLASPGRVRELVDRLGDTGRRTAELAAQCAGTPVAAPVQACADVVLAAHAAAQQAADVHRAEHDAVRVLSARQAGLERRFHRGPILDPGLRRLLRAELDGIRADLAARLDRLAAADAALRAALTAALPGVPDVAGLLDTPQQAALVAQVRAAAEAHPPVSAVSRAAVRDALTAAFPLADPDPLRGFLGAHPEVADLLVEPFPDATDPELPPGPLRDAVAGHHATSRHRVAAIAAAARDIPAPELLRLALLHPAVVTHLDGVPLRPRTAASRLALRATLTRLRRNDIGLEDVAMHRIAQAARRPLTALRDEVERSLVASDYWRRLVALPASAPDVVRRGVRLRLRLYLDLLSQPVGDTRGGFTRRQLVLFDDRGRGRAAEVFGVVDERTRHLAVLVPGTGTGAEGFGGPASVARRIAEADPDRATLAAVWMGADFPAAIGTHSFRPGFARAGGEPLRDFVGGLRELYPQLRPVTVIGHSYGSAMVGAADREGLEADRVLLAAAPGAGPGVATEDDYPPTDALGRGRDVRRFTMTAPGDPVRWSRAATAPERWWPGRLWRPVSRVIGRAVLGRDPERIDGIEVLDTGTYKEGEKAGQPLRGPLGHRHVTHEGTTAFDNIMAVIRARDDELHRAGGTLTGN